MDILQQIRIDAIRTLKSPKIYITILISVFFLNNFTKNLKTYAAAEHLGIPPYIYPIYFSEWINCIYVLLAITILMSDAPFRGNNELYLSLRMNKYRWIISKTLFILLLSLSFQVVMLIAGIVMLFPYIGISQNWGDVLQTYMYSASLNTLTIGDTSSAANLMENYIPINALFLEFLLMSLFGFAIGLLIFLLNEILWRYSGIIVSFIIIFSDLFIRITREFSNIKLSYLWEIVSWFNLGNKMYTSAEDSISIFYIFGFLILLILTFVILIIITAKRKQINILKES